MMSLTEKTPSPKAKEWGRKGISVWLELEAREKDRGEAKDLNAMTADSGWSLW